MCPLKEKKERLLQAAPEIYYETDHYKGWPALLMRMDVVSEDELRHRLKRIWLTQAGKTKAKTLLRERETPSDKRQLEATGLTEYLPVAVPDGFGKAETTSQTSAPRPLRQRPRTLRSGRIQDLVNGEARNRYRYRRQ